MEATIIELRSNGGQVVLNTGHVLRIRPDSHSTTTHWGPEQKVQLDYGAHPPSISILNLETNQKAEADLDFFFKK